MGRETDQWGCGFVCFVRKLPETELGQGVVSAPHVNLHTFVIHLKWRYGITIAANGGESRLNIRVETTRRG